MEAVNFYMNHEIALSLWLRVILGILFLFQGVDKVFKLGINKVADSFKYEMGARKIPKRILFMAAVFTSYVEFIGGILLIVGLFKTYTFYFLGMDLIMVTLAFSIIHPLWDMKFVLPRVLLLGILLYLPPQWDYFSLDFQLGAY